MVAGATAARNAFLRKLGSRLDATRASVRQGMVVVVVVGVGLVLGAVVLGVAVVLVILGASEGISRAVGAPSWVGQLVVGGGILLTLLAATSLSLARYQRASLRRVRDKYACEPDSRQTPKSEGQAAARKVRSR